MNVFDKLKNILETLGNRENTVCINLYTIANCTENQILDIKKIHNIIIWIRVYFIFHHFTLCLRACLYTFTYIYNLSRYVFHSYLQYNPLKVWLYRSGFARFSNTRFSLDSIEDTCILSNLYKQMMLVIKYSDTPETVTWCERV